MKKGLPQDLIYLYDNSNIKSLKHKITKNEEDFVLEFKGHLKINNHIFKNNLKIIGEKLDILYSNLSNEKENSLHISVYDLNLVKCLSEKNKIFINNFLLKRDTNANILFSEVNFLSDKLYFNKLNIKESSIYFNGEKPEISAKEIQISNVNLKELKIINSERTLIKNSNISNFTIDSNNIDLISFYGRNTYLFNANTVKIHDSNIQNLSFISPTQNLVIDNSHIEKSYLDSKEIIFKNKNNYEGLSISNLSTFSFLMLNLFL